MQQRRYFISKSVITPPNLKKYPLLSSQDLKATLSYSQMAWLQMRV